ncbi:hypothetical protein QR680_003276 [Steinernema hermaphroditum]|uniref:ShKT domain-containing protein n=1 Tax=Steinernema hermaphroditum TaxID=289476 RepID=A0AA39H633_9BILA|nr:hypothetical protein QR680_003276 [Steinernema hermaphroditum]
MPYGIAYCRRTCGFCYNGINNRFFDSTLYAKHEELYPERHMSLFRSFSSSIDVDNSRHCERGKSGRSPVCEDTDTSLCAQVTRQACRTRPGYYLKVCPKTCKNCTGIICVDSFKVNCTDVKARGVCTHSLAKEYCPKSCDYCSRVHRDLKLPLLIAEKTTRPPIAVGYKRGARLQWGSTISSSYYTASFTVFFSFGAALKMQHISAFSVALLVGCFIATSLAEQAFAITDKVGQGNFARVFGFNDGEVYRIGKRNSDGLDSFAFANPRDPRQRFAKHNGPTQDFAFAFAKRSNFAKRDDLSDDIDASKFAFAKRAGNFALVRRFAFA